MLLAVVPSLWCLQVPSLEAEPMPVSEAKMQSHEFQTGIAEHARAVANKPQLRGLSERERQQRIESAVGNMLFVAMHELGHAVRCEMELQIGTRDALPSI